MQCSAVIVASCTQHPLFVSWIARAFVCCCCCCCSCCCYTVLPLLMRGKGKRKKFTESGDSGGGGLFMMYCLAHGWFVVRMCFSRLFAFIFSINDQTLYALGCVSSARGDSPISWADGGERERTCSYHVSHCARRVRYYLSVYCFLPYSYSYCFEFEGGECGSSRRKGGDIRATVQYSTARSILYTL